MTIRKATAKDRDGLNQILIDALAFDPEEIDAALEIVDEYLRNGPGEYHIYVQTDRKNNVRAFVCYGEAALSAHAFDLYWIVVHPDFQRRNIGTNLMNLVEKAVRKDGGRMILIETSSSPGYGKARRFYRRLGYRQIARIPDFYRRGDHKLIFMKNSLVPDFRPA